MVVTYIVHDDVAVIYDDLRHHELWIVWRRGDETMLVEFVHKRLRAPSSARDKEMIKQLILNNNKLCPKKNKVAPPGGKGRREKGVEEKRAVAPWGANAPRPRSQDRALRRDSLALGTCRNAACPAARARRFNCRDAACPGARARRFNVGTFNRGRPGARRGQQRG